MIALDLGCGNLPKTKELWSDAKRVGVDYQPTPSVDVIADVRYLPFVDGCAVGAMASHILEHLDRFDTYRAMKEWARVLAEGAELHIQLPDLEWIGRQFVERSKNVELIHILLCLYGKQTKRGEYHYMAFTSGMLYDLMREAGLTKIKVHRAKFLLALPNLEPILAGALWGIGVKGGSSNHRMS